MTENMTGDSHPRNIRTLKRVLITLVVILTVALAFVMPINAAEPWAGTTKTEPTQGHPAYGYLITDGSELAWIAHEVNSGNTSVSSARVTLQNDIDLGGKEWTPIGNDTHPFAGNFTGNDKNISNLTITGNQNDVGLFGNVSGGKIEKLNIKNVVISGGKNVGAIAGYVNGATISNVAGNQIEITATSHAGGLFGSVTTQTMGGWKNVTNSIITIQASGANEGGSAGNIAGTADVTSYTTREYVDNVTIHDQYGLTIITNDLLRLNGNPSVVKPTISISNADQLKKFRDGVNSGAYTNVNTNSGTLGVNVSLEVDIDLEGDGWEKIKEFDGTFDGNEHKIYNLKFSNDDASRSDIFVSSSKPVVVDLSFEFAQSPKPWDGTTKTQPQTMTTGYYAGYYTITSGSELAWIAEQVNEGTGSSSNVYLSNDIDLGGKEWTPIGNDTHPFAGNFIGNGNNISNLTITSNQNNAGLFGNVSGGKIEKLNIKNVVISGGKNVGAIAGYVNGATISTVTGDYIEITATSHAGGLFGSVTTPTMGGWKNVTNSIIIIQTSGVNEVGSAGNIAGTADVTSYTTKEYVHNVTIRDQYGLTIVTNDYIRGDGVTQMTEPELTINSLDELKKFRDGVNNGSYENVNINCYYKLGVNVSLESNINLNNEQWTPIGNATHPFIGTFDGKNNTISNLTISSTENNIGLFGTIQSGDIKNIILENVVISGEEGVGSLAGYVAGDSITNCHVKGTISVTGDKRVGGLIGKVTATQVVNCAVTGDSASKIKSTDQDAYAHTGGLIGFVEETSSSVKSCTANIDVEGYASVGGLVGSTYGSIADSTSMGTVNLLYASSLTNDGGDATNKASAGALVGLVLDTSASISNSDSTSSITVANEFSNNPEKTSIGFVGAVHGTTYNDPTAVERLNSQISDSTWTPPQSNYNDLAENGYIKLDFTDVKEPTADISKPSTSSPSSSQGSSTWLQESVTPTVPPTESSTDSQAPTDIPSTQPTATPASPGFGVLAALAGLGAVATLRRQ